MRAALAAQPGLSEHLLDAEPELVVAPLAGSELDETAAKGLDLILEGFLLHHGHPRHLDLADTGRRVLAGDYCYAFGLTRVAEHGDLAVIDLLADLVALSASLVATGDRTSLGPLWRSTVAAIADPDSTFRSELADAKAGIRSGADHTAIAQLATRLPPAPMLQEALDA